MLWANLHLLFWLSLVPFATAWIGENHFAATPMALYGVCLGAGSPLRRAPGTDRKGKASPVLYLAAIPLAFVSRWLAGAIYLGVALMWLVPDRRIEHAIVEEPGIAR